MRRYDVSAPAGIPNRKERKVRETITVDLTLEKEGRKLDTYEMNVTLDGIVINVGSIHILRSLIEERKVIIEFDEQYEEITPDPKTE